MTMSQMGGDSQNTMPNAVNAGIMARRIAQGVPVDPNAAKFSMDAFKNTLKNPGSMLEATSKNLPISEALAQQSWFARMAGKLPFVKNFLGPDFILNSHIGGLGKDALNGVSKASVTKIALEGGDVAGKLIAAGVPQEAAEGIAKKGVERLAAAGGTALATSTATTVATGAADDLAKQALGMTMKKGFTVASEEAVKKALTSPNAYETLKGLGFYAKDAKALVAKAATTTAETAAKTATTNTAGKVATETVKKAGGIKGFFGKLLSGAKGNFVVAGVFALATNTFQLAQGKINLKQWAALTLVDTAAYGAIGWGSAAAGAAIGTALFPGVGTLAGFVIGLGLGFIGGSIYEKFLRNPIKDALGGAPAGGADQSAYDPSAYETQYAPNPYAAPTGGGVTAPPAYNAPPVGTGMSYEDAMRHIEQMK